MCGCVSVQELDPLYKLLCKSLELEERVELLNARVTVVRELLDVLSGELANKHASRLEEIIIWLICVEIIIEMVKGHLFRKVLSPIPKSPSHRELYIT